MSMKPKNGILSKSTYPANSLKSKKTQMVNKTVSINNYETESSMISNTEMDSQEYYAKLNSLTDAIDFAAFLVFFISYFLFNSVYMVNHM